MTNLPRYVKIENLKLLISWKGSYVHGKILKIGTQGLFGPQNPMPLREIQNFNGKLVKLK